jgi:hypothetical protein
VEVKLKDYDLDWSNGRVVGKDLDRSIVEHKFALWDYVRDNSLLKTDDDAPLLLKDDTIFAYQFLKWNGEPIKLRYYQDAIMNDKHRIVDVEAANQQGKTFALCVKAAVSFLRDHHKNWTIALVSRSQIQNGTNMRMIKQMLSDSDLGWEVGANDSMSVTVRNTESGYTNTLICAVAGGGALGLPVDLLLMDEYEFWMEDANKSLAWYFDQIFYPRTFETRGQIIIYSNPNGKNFVSEDLQKRKYKESGDYVCHTYNINFLDNPDNKQAEWDDRMSHVHPIIFASTMAAERTEAEGSALTNSDIQGMFTDEALIEQERFYGYEKEVVFFLDLGFVKDQSVLVGLTIEKDENGKTFVKEFLQKFYPINYGIDQIFGKSEGTEETIPQVLAKYIKEGVQPIFGMDITGKEGNEIHATDVGIDVVPVKMSGQWKATWYGHWTSFVKQRRFKSVNLDNYRDGKNKNFDSQCRTLKMSTKNSQGMNRAYPLYHHTTEADLDDVVDATVGAFSLIDEDLAPQVDMTFTPYENVIHQNKEEVIFEDDPEKTIMEQETRTSFDIW